MPDQLARAVDVRQPQRTRADAEDVVVDEVVLLAGRLVDAVDVGRSHQLRFVDRQAIGLAVDLRVPRVHDFRPRIVLPAGFEQRQLRAAVDLEIRVGIPHAVDVADLARQVEDDLAVAHEVVHRRALADVGDVHAQARFIFVEVEQIAAVVGISESTMSTSAPRSTRGARGSTR